MFEQITAENEIDRGCINQIIQEGSQYFSTIFQQLNLPTLAQLARVLLQEVKEIKANEQRAKQQIADIKLEYQKEEADRCEYISTLEEECEALRSMINFLQAKQEQYETKYNQMNSSSIQIISQMNKQMREMRQSQVQLQIIQKDCHAKQGEIKKMTIIINKLLQQNQAFKKFKVQNAMLTEQLEQIKNKYIQSKLTEDQLRAEHQNLRKIIVDLQQKVLDMEYIIKLKEKEIKSSDVQLNLLNTGKENASILKSLQNNFQSNFMVSSSRSSQNKSKGSRDFENSLDNVSENWDKLSLKEIEASSKHKPELDTIFQGFQIKRRPFMKFSNGGKQKEVKNFTPIQDQQLLIPVTISNKKETIKSKNISKKESKLDEYTKLKEKETQNGKEGSLEKSLYAYTISQKKIDSNSLTETYIFQKINSDFKKQCKIRDWKHEKQNITLERAKEQKEKKQNGKKKEELQKIIIQLLNELKQQELEKKLILDTKNQMQSEGQRARDALIKEMKQISDELGMKKIEKEEGLKVINRLQLTVKQLKKDIEDKDKFISALKKQKIRKQNKQTNTMLIFSSHAQTGTQDYFPNLNKKEFQSQTVILTSQISCQSQANLREFSIKPQMHIKIQQLFNSKQKDEKDEIEQKKTFKKNQIQQNHPNFENKENSNTEMQEQTQTVYYSFLEEQQKIDYYPAANIESRISEQYELDIRKIADAANQIIKRSQRKKSYAIEFQKPQNTELTIFDILERLRSKKKQYYIFKGIFREKGKNLKDHLLFWKQGVLSIRKKQFLLNIDKKIAHCAFTLLLGNSQIILSESLNTIQIKRSTNTFLVGDLQDYKWTQLNILAYGSYSY